MALFVPIFCSSHENTMLLKAEHILRLRHIAEKVIEPTKKLWRTQKKKIAA